MKGLEDIQEYLNNEYKLDVVWWKKMWYKEVHIYE